MKKDIIEEEDQFQAKVQFMINVLIPVLKISEGPVTLTAISILMGHALARNPENVQHNLRVMQNLIAESYHAALQEEKNGANQ